MMLPKDNRERELFIEWISTGGHPLLFPFVERPTEEEMELARQGFNNERV